jgi:hypothetical protein
MHEQLQKRGFECHEQAQSISPEVFNGVKGVVIPPPTGKFIIDDLMGGHWEPTESSRFTALEIEAILTFLSQGGWLFAFTYRFGDSFTKSNLGQLFAALGIILNDDAVMDLDALNRAQPGSGLTNLRHELSGEAVSRPWRTHRIRRLALRPTATFGLLKSSRATTVIMSPTTSVRYGFHFEKTYFDSAPICVAGHHGEGRYVLFGGPHQFESTNFGLLREADNCDFLNILIDWLIEPKTPFPASVPTTPPLSSYETVDFVETDRRQLLWQAVTNAKASKTKGTSFVDFIKHLFLDSTAMELLDMSAWSLERESEIDLVYECTRPTPLWSSCRGVVPVECKNEKRGVDGERIAWFGQKINNTGSQLGFFAARAFTKPAWSIVKDIRINIKL